MPASSLAFLAELINVSDRHLNFLFIDIRFTQTSVITNISIFLTIADNQIDGQNNESEVQVNALGYPVQNSAQISKLIYRYYKLSVCLWVDTKMLVRDILAIFVSLFYVNRVNKLCKTLPNYSYFVHKSLYELWHRGRWRKHLWNM